MPGEARTAFFSYSREDSEFALRLAGDLKAAGANVWLDQLDIQPGQRWARAVQDALNNAERVLVILSPASAASSNVEDEVTFALDEHKDVIPVLYRDCQVPLRLRPLQYVDFRSDYQRGLSVLLKTLKAQLASDGFPKIEAEALDAGKAVRAQQGREMPPGAGGVSISWSRPAKALLAIGTLLVIAFLAFYGLVKWRAASRPTAADNTLTAITLPPNANPEIRDLYERAKSGDSQAALRLGFAFEGGAVVPVNLSYAAALYRMAAEAGNAQAMSDYGWALKNGRGVNQNYREAVSWFRKSAEAANPSGMDNLGVMYLFGNGVEQDYDQAFLWLRKAAEAGNPDAMFHFGWMYLNGWGTQKDFKQAESWSRKAAEAGEPGAMANLGEIYENGLGVKKDLKQAHAWYQNAAQLGNEHAKKALVRLQASQ